MNSLSRRQVGKEHLDDDELLESFGAVASEIELSHASGGEGLEQLVVAKGFAHEAEWILTTSERWTHPSTLGGRAWNLLAVEGEDAVPAFRGRGCEQGLAPRGELLRGAVPGEARKAVRASAKRRAR